MPSRIEYRDQDGSFKFESNIIPGEATVVMTVCNEGTRQANLVMCDATNRYTDVYDLATHMFQLVEGEDVRILELPINKRTLQLGDEPLVLSLPPGKEGGGEDFKDFTSNHVLNS